jgi:hypothetical protein
MQYGLQADSQPWYPQDAFQSGYAVDPSYYTQGSAQSSYIDQSYPMPTAMDQLAYNTANLSLQQPSPQGNYHQGQGDYYQGGTAQAGSKPQKAQAPSSKGFVETQQKKIMVRGLSSSTGYDQFRDLINSTAGADCRHIAHISLPENDKGKARGYGLVMFRHSETARKVLERLDGYDWNGKTLRVEYTKEGVSKAEGQRKTTHHRRSEKRRHEEQGESSKPGGGSDRKGKVVVADGSSQYFITKHGGSSKHSR